MAILLMILGALSACAGVAAIAYGMPIKEFSLGNTLILSGTTAAVGGVLIVAVCVAIRQLREIADGLASRPIGSTAARADLPAPLAQAARPPARSAGTANAPGRVAFPTRPKTDAERTSDKPETVVPALPPLSFDAPATPFARSAEEERPAPVIPPPLEEIVPEPIRAEPLGGEPMRNEPPFGNELVSALGSELRSGETIETDQALQERREAAWQEAHHDANKVHANEPAADGRREEQEGSVEGFDSIWDRDARPASPAPAEPRAEAPEFIRRIKSPPPSEQRVEARSEPHLDPRSAPILKSGVVDGMGYTLYVDGSIEAELPQGTVRFASIAELREHLEKNG